jgi:hypothetical protein
MATLMEYLKALKWYWMLLFLTIYILSQAVQVCSSFWLSNWSNQVDNEKDNPALRNRNLIVYVVLGFSQSKS